jgi:leucyl aminopeptidase (aminopeptidase T)
VAPAGDSVHRKLEYIYQRAILELDHAALKKRQQTLVDKIRGKSLRVTTPEGTDITFSLPADGWYHQNNGDMSREKGLAAVCARDREEEVPCGAVRTVPAPDSANGVISLQKRVAWNGFPFDVNEYVPLEIVFKDGRITEWKSQKDNAKLNAIYAGLTGDKDRLGEIVIGTNPLLETPKGAGMPTYWGFGDGAFRFHLGDNIESAGKYRSNLWINLFLSDVTVTCEGEVLVQDGKLA